MEVNYDDLTSFLTSICDDYEQTIKFCQILCDLRYNHTVLQNITMPQPPVSGAALQSYVIWASVTIGRLYQEVEILVWPYFNIDKVEMQRSGEVGVSGNDVCLRSNVVGMTRKGGSLGCNVVAVNGNGGVGESKSEIIRSHVLKAGPVRNSRSDSHVLKAGPAKKLTAALNHVLVRGPVGEGQQNQHHVLSTGPVGDISLNQSHVLSTGPAGSSMSTHSHVLSKGPASCSCSYDNERSNAAS